jgi:hypothetical protein
MYIASECAIQNREYVLSIAGIQNSVTRVHNCFKFYIY